MRTLGIIGGIGPESTIEYYRLILAKYHRLRPDGTSPSIVINSIDLKRLLDLAAAPQPEPLISYLRVELDRLKSAGAHISLMAANTLGCPRFLYQDS
jgi:aspartate racemase